MNRRELFATALALAPGGCSRGGGDCPVGEVDISTLAVALGEGRTTARGLVDSYLRRIAGIDRSGPRLNSVIELNPDAAAIAEALDRERKEKGPRGPLHGIPILIKDNIDTADRMKTTAGSMALVDAPAPKEDAPLVARLREAGPGRFGKPILCPVGNPRSPLCPSSSAGRRGEAV